MTGPRAWEDAASVCRRLGDLVTARIGADPPQRVVVEHGDAADGVDAHTRAWLADVTRYGWVGEKRWPADWDSDLGKAAGMVRNRRMIDSRPDALLAFLKVCELPPERCRIYKRHPDRTHWTHGAGQCFEYATRQGVPTYVVEWPIRHMPARRWELPPAPTPPGLFEEHWAETRRTD